MQISNLVKPTPLNRLTIFRWLDPRAMEAERDLCGLSKDGVWIPTEIRFIHLGMDKGLLVLSAIVDDWQLDKL
jgi:hypothetical protein